MSRRPIERTALAADYLSIRALDTLDPCSRQTQWLKVDPAQEGWPIHSHNDDASLKPGEYRLVSVPKERKDVDFSRAISGRLKAQVLDRNGFTCQMCGLTPGDIDPDTGRKVRMHIGHIVDKSLGGKDELGNLRSLCSGCNEGAKNITLQKPSTIWLLGQIRRSGMQEQRAVYDWLATKFGDG